MNWLVAVAIGVGVALAGFFIFTAAVAQGVPTAPTVTLQTTLNPNAAQVVTIAFQTQVASTLAVNPTSKVIYSAAYGAVTGPLTFIANNSSVVLSQLSASGNVYTLGATVTLAVPGLCATIGCAGYQENLTIWATTQVSTYLTLHNSVTTKVVFSTNLAYTTKQVAPQVGFNSWYWNFFGSATALTASVLTLVYLVTRHAIPGVGALVAWGALAIEAVLWLH